jgi:uncharacterized protein YqfB (UPF0267 family)
MILNDFVIEPIDIKTVSNLMLSDETNKLASDEVMKFSLLQEVIKKMKQNPSGNSKNNFRFMC